MNFEQHLDDVAASYRKQGYDVVVRPGTADLPGFADDFTIEILAKRPDGNVLVSAKRDQTEMKVDRNLARYAQVIEAHPGWRYDLFVFGSSDAELITEMRRLEEQSDDQIRRTLDDAQRMLQGDFLAQSFVAAWAALESAMRRTVKAHGSEAGWGTSPRTMLNELVSSGEISIPEFRDLEGLFEDRNAIVHGFATPAVEQSSVQFVLDTARRLLEESYIVAQTG